MYNRNMKPTQDVKRRILRVLLVWGALFLSVGAALLALRLWEKALPCPIYTWTGLRCPACGNTRALLALLQGDFKEMAMQNLMFLPELVFLAGLVLSGGIQYIRFGTLRITKRGAAFCTAFLILLVLWCFLRNKYHI